MPMETARLPRTELDTKTATAWTLRLPRGRMLALGGQPRVMGILNLTPDSFSDGGRFASPARAVEAGLAMLAAGADLLDLGAESTRPGGGVYGVGAEAVPASQELDRLGPVLEGLRRETDAPLSVDTRKGEVARQALDAGADLVNDVSALSDPALGAAVAAAGCPLVLMHSRGELPTMQRGIAFGDLLGEVGAELAAAGERATAAGIAFEQLIFDPGIGFGKTAEQNLSLIRHLDRLAGLGRPLLLGASRKSFLARALERRRGGRPGPPPPPAGRLAASLAVAAWAPTLPVAVLRVHDVAETVDLLTVWQAIAEAGA
jgi:dihydropteroate synthase